MVSNVLSKREGKRGPRVSRPVRGFASTTASALSEGISGAVSVPDAPPPPPPSKPASDVVAGAFARAASQSTIHPLDTLKVRMQAKDATNSGGLSKFGKLVPPPGGKINALKTARNVGSGVKSLYKGVFSAASGAGIAIGAYFAFYSVAKNMLARRTNLPNGGVAFVAGGVAAAGSSVVKVPIAVCIRSVQAGVYRNVIEASRSIVAAAGPRGLFVGYLPTLLEDVPDMACKFAAYETIRSVYRRFVDGRQATPTEDFAMGAVAGAFAAAATTPLDVIKTNMMCSAASRPSMVSAAQHVYQTAGVKGFLRGVGPRAVSNGINSAVFFCFFEAISGILAAQHASNELARQNEMQPAVVAVEKVDKRNGGIENEPSYSVA